jgi:superfamily II DNA or RNA helicase
LREWQRRALAEMEAWSDGSFLISAAPGAGKTRPGGGGGGGGGPPPPPGGWSAPHPPPQRRAVHGVVIACPTAPLTRQWARAAHQLGLELLPDADSPRPPSGFHGVVVTYARIANSSRRWAAGTRERTLVIADEAHHLGEELAWGESFAAAFMQASRWLLLSGTPFRSDAAPIPGVEYDANGLAEPHVSYSYAEAVCDGVCRPVVFVTYDGTLSWRSGDDVIESSFDAVLSSREASRRYRTAISTELPDGLPRILGEAHVRLQALRSGTHPEAGGLVIAADSEHARKVAAQLRAVAGRAPAVVLHQDAKAAQKLAAFTHSGEPWIVAVNMVSEGVDIPRLRVGVYATAAKTPLIFRQIVGRFVRTISGRAPEPSWLYIPADTILRDHAANVETELRYMVRRGTDQELGEIEELGRPKSERGEVLDFEPLSADVAAQMSLFGPALAASAATVSRRTVPAAPVAAVPLPSAVQPPTPTDSELPAFERRAQLRAKRHRLVADLARDLRSSHKEVNAQVNRTLGIDSVDKATIEQLQSSIEWLDQRLYGSKR